MPVQGPTEGNPNDLNDKPSDIGGGAPSDIISGPSIDTEEEPTEEQPEEQDTDVDIDIDNIEQPEEPRELS